jgi:4'-phosphopantetheinyl transferase
VPAVETRLSLADGDVHLWQARATSSALDLEDAGALLAADELARARGFRRPQDRRQFIACRVILRQILAGYLGTEPRAVSFDYNRHGKPRLSGEGPESLCFSVAHSAGAALYGFARRRRIGVDLEFMRHLAILDLARQFFAPEEIAALRDLPAAGQHAAFYRCWTRKEAYLKAHGLGLSVALDAFAVSVTPGELWALSWSDLDPEDVGRWSFLEPAVGEGFAAAVAVESTERAGPVRFVVRGWGLHPAPSATGVRGLAPAR